MLPRDSTSDVRFEAVERELHVYEIKANKCCVWPLARGINSPHAHLWKAINISRTREKNDEPHSLDPRLVAVDNLA
jgi:hypothetical protein